MAEQPPDPVVGLGSGGGFDPQGDGGYGGGGGVGGVKSAVVWAARASARTVPSRRMRAIYLSPGALSRRLVTLPTPTFMVRMH